MAIYTWRVGSGDFAVAADWTLNGAVSATVPGAGDTATFAGGSGNVSGTGTVNTLNFASVAAQAWTVTGQLSSTGNLSVGFTGSAGQVTIGSGGVVSLADGFAAIANGANATGTLAITAGGTLRYTATPQLLNYALNIGGYSTSTGANGTLTVQGTGALLDMTGSGVSVGLAGTGTLAISSGGVAKVGNLVNPGGNANTAGLSIGRGGSGTVTVSGQGSSLQVLGAFYAGRASGSSGTISVSNGGTLTQTAVNGDYNNVGNAGPVNNTTVSGGIGTFTVASAGMATFGNGLVVGYNGAHGTVTVTGVSSTLSLGGALFVGGGGAVPAFSGGSGALFVQAGGRVTSTAAADTTLNYLQIANSNQSTGAVTVDGIGSVLDLGMNAVSVGSGGTGSFTISGGGTARSGTTHSGIRSALQVGSNAQSSGTMTVTGAGSAYTGTGAAYFGRGGTGSLVVDQGGSFTGGVAPVLDGIGANAGYGVTVGSGESALDANGQPIAAPRFGGSGSATVSSLGRLHSLYNLTVGTNGDSGSLIVDTGGTVAADRQVTVGSGTDRAGGTGTVTVQGGGSLSSGGQHLLGLAGISIGVSPGNTGSVTVTGAGSLLDTKGDRLSVGTNSTTPSAVSGATAGTLTIGNGGAVLAGASYADAEAALAVGAAAGATGTVTIGGTGSRLIASGLAVLGGNSSGAGLAAGGTGLLTVTMGGLFRATDLALFTGSNITVQGGTGVIGTGVGTATRLTVDAGHGISGAGSIGGVLLNNGTVTAQGGLLSVNLTDGSGTGIYAADGGTLQVQGFAGSHLRFGGTSTIRIVSAPNPTADVAGFQVGDVLDFAGAGTLTVNGNVVSAGSRGTYTFTGLGPTALLSVVADGSGGQEVVAKDALFDAAYYLAANPDVAGAGVDPYQHYMAYGWHEGRDPSAWFSTSYYLAHNPDVAAAGLNPLTHFEAHGWTENRDPAANFDLSDYLAANADVKASGFDALFHFMIAGRAEGRAAFRVGVAAPDALFDASYYYAANPDVKAVGADALDHYLAHGFAEGRNPDAWFDSSYYLAQNPDVAAAGVNPMVHFEQHGYLEGRQPSLLFDGAKYLAHNPDTAGFDPLMHFLQYGQAEGRQAYLTGGTAAADPLVDTAYYDRQLGATLIPTGAAGARQAAYSYDAVGWQRGLNPDAWFDTNYYLAHNADVAAAHIDPLIHYEAYGWHEGRDPSAQFSTHLYLGANSDVAAAGVNPLLHYVEHGQFEGRQAFHV